MRTLVKASVPVEAGNKAIADGSLPRAIQDTLEKLRPEAAYFFTEAGRRCALFVIDLQDTSQIPAIAEPFFTLLNAEVDFRPVMSAQDLQRGLTTLAAAKA